jgi:hypothetical protein
MWRLTSRFSSGVWRKKLVVVGLVVLQGFLQKWLVKRGVFVVKLWLIAW